jgi:hypothetical protein
MKKQGKKERDVWQPERSETKKKKRKEEEKESGIWRRRLK